MLYDAVFRSPSATLIRRKFLVIPIQNFRQPIAIPDWKALNFKFFGFCVLVFVNLYSKVSTDHLPNFQCPKTFRRIVINRNNSKCRKLKGQFINFDWHPLHRFTIGADTGGVDAKSQFWKAFVWKVDHYFRRCFIEKLAENATKTSVIPFFKKN